MTFDEANMKLTFQSSERNDPSFSGATHTFTITATAGTNDDVIESIDFTIPFRCFIEQSDFVWITPAYILTEFIRRDYIEGWTFPEVIIDPLNPINDPFYSDPPDCAVELPLEFVDWYNTWTD